MTFLAEYFNLTREVLRYLKKSKKGGSKMAALFQIKLDEKEINEVMEIDIDNANFPSAVKSIVCQIKQVVILKKEIKQWEERVQQMELEEVTELISRPAKELGWKKREPLLGKLEALIQVHPLNELLEVAKKARYTAASMIGEAIGIRMSKILPEIMAQLPTEIQHKILSIKARNGLEIPNEIIVQLPRGTRWYIKHLTERYYKRREKLTE